MHRDKYRNKFKPGHTDAHPKGVPDKLTQKGVLRWRMPFVDASPEELAVVKQLPPAADEFDAIRRRLNEAKSRQDPIPPKDFSDLTWALDLYQGLKKTFLSEYNFQIATNATLKMYELIVQEKLIVCDANSRIRLFANAELPGAFLVAVNHYVRTSCAGANFDWLASSYYPAEAARKGDTTILGDRYGIYAANRRNWLMGPQPNAHPLAPIKEELSAKVPPAKAPLIDGDLTSAAVVAALADAVHARFGADRSIPSGATIYTSDAGIDVSSDYGRQEEMTALLNFGQILCGILSLAPGGNLVTKQYTFFTPLNRSLICIVASLFDTVDIVKPLTSRPANSEIYLVAKGFRGIDKRLAASLLNELASLQQRADDASGVSNVCLVDEVILRLVDEALLRVARQLYDRQQVLFLAEAVALYEKYKGNLNGLARVLHPEARRLQDIWLADNPVVRLRSEFGIRTTQGAGPPPSAGQDD